ncbi:MAG: hypothetical protein WCE90_05030 [Candidatus Zixiibacteriota bacterium]
MDALLKDREDQALSAFFFARLENTDTLRNSLDIMLPLTFLELLNVNQDVLSNHINGRIRQ